MGQIDELAKATGATPEVNQIRWGPSIYDPAVATGLQQRGVVLEAYSPFKVSNLSDPTLVSIASEHDAAVIVAWHVAHGFVVILKSSRVDRIVANAAGANRPVGRRGRRDRWPLEGLRSRPVAQVG